MATKITKLSAEQIDKKLKSLSGWVVNKQKTQLSKAYDFRSYLDGLTFIARIAVHAEILHHYPEIELTHTKVKIKLTSAEIKALSKVDFELASIIEKISQR